MSSSGGDKTRSIHLDFPGTSPSSLWGMPKKTDLDQRPSPWEILQMTAEITAAYVSRNAIPTSQVSALIQTIHRSLAMAPQRARTNGRRKPRRR